MEVERWKGRIDGVIEGDQRSEWNDCHHRSASEVSLRRVLGRKRNITRDGLT